MPGVYFGTALVNSQIKALPSLLPPILWRKQNIVTRIAILDAGKLLSLGSPQQVRELASKDKHIVDMNEALLQLWNKLLIH